MALSILACVCAGSAALAVPVGARASAAGPSRSLEQSRELWATVDVCNPANERNTVGIRGSMPGDGHSHDAMYMRFQLQYRQAQGGWTNLTRSGATSFIGVGSARTARQGGTSFQLTPIAGRPAYTMRGVVTFQWRHGAKVLHELTRTTTSGHPDAADADPRGYTAAQCTLG